METPVRALPDINRDVTFQDYSPQPCLPGVVHRTLSTFAALDGSVTELFRMSGGAVEGLPGEPFDLRQLTLSHCIPFRINAFHLHPRQRQDEIWTVLAGSLKVWLVDLREDSDTVGQRACFHLIGHRLSQLVIPWGVAHGYQGGHQGATMVYAMNAQFDREVPNEGRLPWDYFGADLWQPDRG